MKRSVEGAILKICDNEIMLKSHPHHTRFINVFERAVCMSIGSHIIHSCMESCVTENEVMDRVQRIMTCSEGELEVCLRKFRNDIN